VVSRGLACETTLNPFRKRRKPSRSALFVTTASVPCQISKLERILNDKLVYCANKGDGCDWKGRLAELEKHLDPKPSPDKKIVALKDGCQFKRVECRFCKEMFYQFTIKQHAQTCRQVTCTYCKTYTDAASKMEKHYSECTMYPVPCPNDCGSKPFRKNISKHVDENCPLTLVECSFSMLGCDVMMARKYIKEHEDLSDHIILAAATMASLKEENEKLKEEIRRRPQSPTKFLRVTDLPPGVNEQKLKSLFGQYGLINEITMSGTISARIEYYTENSVESALRRSEEKGIRLNSVTLSLSRAY
jgi:hypothetical protein